MDSDGLLFQTATDSLRSFDSQNPNVPIRCHTAMVAQPILSWTPVSVLAAFVAWLVAETPLTPAVAAVPVQNNRRA